MPVDEIIIDAEIAAKRFPADMDFNFYFSPISHIFSMKWSSEPSAEDEIDDDTDEVHQASDVRLQYKRTIIEKCV